MSEIDKIDMSAKLTYPNVIMLHSYETSDGVSRSEEAVVKNVGTEEEGIEVHGVITWTAPDGEQYTLKFVADENGYRPEGTHLP